MSPHLARILTSDLAFPPHLRPTPTTLVVLLLALTYQAIVIRSHPTAASHTLHCLTLVYLDTQCHCIAFAK